MFAFIFFVLHMYISFSSPSQLLSQCGLIKLAQEISVVHRTKLVKHASQPTLGV